MKPSLTIGMLLLSMSLMAACTTNITVTGPASTISTAASAVVASCQADAKSIETALEAYKAVLGQFRSGASDHYPA